MPGPLPNPQRRRRNAPTIPTTELPASGPGQPAPKLPTGYRLGKVGRAWWLWAWRTPQACGWSPGDLYVVARRATLEDDLDAIERVGGIDLEDEDLAKSIQRLAGLATGRIAVMREMRELDNRLGLNAKAMADLRWTIVTDAEPVAQEEPTTTRRLRAVETVA